MKFLERRKILKKTNSLELIPVRVLEHQLNEQDKVDVLVPRFKNDYFKRAMQTKKREEHIYIHLDETGSLIWLMIDGERNAEELVQKMLAEHPEKLQPPEEAEKRVSQFLSLLYQERYISFRQIMDK